MLTRSDHPDGSQGSDVEPDLVAGICELVLEARDVDLLRRFYVDAFGFKVLSKEADRIWLACGRHVHFAFSAGRGRLHALGQRLAKRGAKFRGPIEHDGGDRSIYVEDPEGNIVEVWDYFEDGEGAEAGVAALA